MRFLIVTICVLFLQSSHADLLDDFCDNKNGKLFTWYQCPKSKLPLRIKTCEYHNSYGELEFVNGCSGPTGGHDKLFFPACVQHDLCYHHEPATNGKGQKYCDVRMLNQLLKICDEKAQNIIRCQKWARFMYRSLRVIGKPAFHCANYYGRYED
ncbi:MAG: hypothetical protein CME64_06415 [Halobacteriovoraceae bacterium]|nr:hypothetical protein [Halobacteriovoraceae bacterium]|tara:strand:+ start:66497 stop:66958 length:462 start_codon:yes stop_codon:yes gene_type:complete